MEAPGSPREPLGAPREPQGEAQGPQGSPKEALMLLQARFLVSKGTLTLLFELRPSQKGI